jgi:hypothetical protein
MRKTTALACAVTGALIVLGLAPTVSAAAPLRCGDTVTADVVLTRNLTCAGDGLQVAGQGVTVDLNGHRLRGDGTGSGITLSAQEVTVTGGRIEGFHIAVRNLGADQTRLHRLTLAANTYGVRAEGGRMEITDSTFRGNGAGLANASYAAVSGSLFRDNVRGILCGDAGLLVVASRFSDNQYGIDSSICGVTVDATSFTGGDVGLTLAPLAFGMNVRNSTFKGAGIGMRVTMAFGEARVIADNEFTGNGASGLVIDTENYPPGVQVSGNLFKGNGFAPGSHVDASGNPLTSGVWANAGTFTGNRSIGNAGHGIEAYAVTDSGGNTAKRNGVEPQCVGVVCTRAVGRPTTVRAQGPR